MSTNLLEEHWLIKTPDRVLEILENGLQLFG